MLYFNVVLFLTYYLKLITYNTPSLLYRFFRSFFFGNYFYGLCAVALSVDTMMRQRLPFNSLAYFVMIFSATVVYYTYAYTSDSNPNAKNERSDWYANNKRFVKHSQVFIGLLFAISFLFYSATECSSFLAKPFLNWLILSIFPLVALLYYGFQTPMLHKLNLRNTGWLKPFIIAFVWAGVVTFFPLFIQATSARSNCNLNRNLLLHFTDNCMFITVLCIMFDIKDYEEDYNRELKTFVVRIGLRKTINYLLFPLCVLGLGICLVHSYFQGFALKIMLVNIIPYILMMVVANSLNERKHILYYLAVIDGLMLVKAICGMIGTF